MEISPGLEQGMNLQLEGWWSAKQGCFKDTGTPLASPGGIPKTHT